MNNMYAMVLFLVVITSTGPVFCSSSDNEQEIFMVVDDQISTMHPAGTGMTKVAANLVQIGRFEIGEGKLLTLSRPLKKERNCISIYQPCGALDWCCEGLKCDGVIEGQCLNDAFCKPRGASCDFLKPCCYPDECDGYWSGICRST